MQAENALYWGILLAGIETLLKITNHFEYQSRYRYGRLSCFVFFVSKTFVEFGQLYYQSKVYSHDKKTLVFLARRLV